MVQWCIRLTRLTLVCKVIRYRLVQVRQNLKKRLFGLAARNRLSLSLPLSFSSSSYYLSFSIQKASNLLSHRMVWYYFLLRAGQLVLQNMLSKQSTLRSSFLQAEAHVPLEPPQACHCFVPTSTAHPARPCGGICIKNDRSYLTTVSLSWLQE